MKLKPIVSILFFFGVICTGISCSDGKKGEAQENKAEVPAEFQKEIELDSIRLVELSERTQKVTDEWMMYIALNSEVERLNGYTILDVVNNSPTIESVVDSLSQTVPEVFETNAISARIITLKTHSKLLLENSERVEPNPSEIEDLSAKLKLDFNNLNIQLNEVFIMEDNANEPDVN
jgi:hypothetical protein